MIRIKRVYEAPAPDDGLRVLVDRLWPRGLTKERAAVDIWMKELAPSHELRRWFHHDPTKWDDFESRYRQELAGQDEALELLRNKSRAGVVTLLYGARDTENNQATVLRSILKRGRR